MTAMAKIVVTALVVLHLAASVWHGGAHSELGVALSPAQNLFVYTVILLAPLVGAVLVWTRQAGAGVWVFFASMLGAFLFGAYHHYVLVSPDNIGHLPSGSAEAHARFVASAATIAGLELASALVGAFLIATRVGRDPLRVRP